MSEPALVVRLIGLFGPQWQAALDHAGVLSRRRAREIGAGADPTSLMLAAVELLEACPRARWPDRWRRLADRFPGKTSDTCPTLEAFADRLHPDGRIDPVDAVFVWDRLQDGPAFRNVNVAVGMLPAALHSRPAADPIQATTPRSSACIIRADVRRCRNGRTTEAFHHRAEGLAHIGCDAASRRGLHHVHRVANRVSKRLRPQGAAPRISVPDFHMAARSVSSYLPVIRGMSR